MRRHIPLHVDPRMQPDTDGGVQTTRGEVRRRCDGMLGTAGGGRMHAPVRYPRGAERLWGILLVLLGLAISLPALAAEPAHPYFSEVERAIWDHALASDAPPSPEHWAALNGLRSRIARTDVELKATLLFHLCRMAVREARTERAAVVAELQAIASAAPYPRGEAAYHKCQQLLASDRDEPREAFQQGYLAYHSLRAADPSSLHAWIAYDYAQAALDAGLLDEAMEAASRSLRIARDNGYPEWEGETLGVVAVIQGELQRFDEALDNNRLALETVTDDRSRGNLRLNRAYILKQAGRVEESLDTYRSIMNSTKAGSDHHLIAGSNVAFILLEQERLEEAAALIDQLMIDATSNPDFQQTAYIQRAQAIALLKSGELEAALQLEADSRAWFIEHNIVGDLDLQMQGWADALARQGHAEKAYEALRESLRLRAAADESQRRNSALLANAALTAEQKNREHLQLRHEHDRNLDMLRQQRLQNRLWLTLVLAVASVSVILYLAIRRLQSTQRALEAKNAELDYESTHDALTRAFNRRYFVRFVERQKPQRADAATLLILVDIDHFKRINDSHGHHTGDEVLKTVVQRLSGCLRDDDCIVRWGGEEFLIYVGAPATAAACKRLVQRLLDAVAEPLSVEPGPLRVTVSAGFARVNVESNSMLERQIDRVDGFLYQAKRQGRSRAIGTLSPENKDGAPDLQIHTPAATDEGAESPCPLTAHGEPPDSAESG